MLDETDMKLDVAQVLRSRLPRLWPVIPRRAVKWLERTICQDEMNRLIEENRGRRDADFCRGILRSLDIKVDVIRGELLPPRDDRRVVYCCNHPLGGLDGMALIHILQRHHGGQVWFIVNDLLMAIKPLAGVFLPINKHGGQSRRAAAMIDEAFAGDDPVIIFPAGLCSRLRREKVDGQEREVVRDLPWQKMFVNKAVKHQRDVIPLYFDGENSDHFYRVAQRRKRLHVPFNVEMLYLPQEVFKARGKRFSVVVGPRISRDTLCGGLLAGASASSLRRMVYILAKLAPGYRGAAHTNRD